MAKNDRTEAAVALSPLLTSAALEALRRHADLRPKWRDVYTGLVRLSQTGGVSPSSSMSPRFRWPSISPLAR